MTRDHAFRGKAERGALMTWKILPALVLGVLVGPAHAQDWRPERNVELIVPAGAGGSLDNTGRTIQRVWDELKLVPVASTVVNRSGGGHSKAYAYLHQQAGNPQVLSITSSTILTNHINGRLPRTYDAFTPLAIMLTEYIAFAVKADSPLKDGKDLIEALRKDPASLSIGISSARGGTHHISVGMPVLSAGIDMKPVKLVPFNSSSTAVTALLGGHVDVISTSNVILAPHVAEGRLRAIAISSPKRIAGPLAETPTWAELGFKGVFYNWRGVIGAGGMTPQQTAFWVRVLKGVAESGEFKAYAAKNQWVIDFRGGADASAFMKEAYGDLQSVMQPLGLAKR
jgi:putative tricarboxylic transport membrane protein